MQEADDASDQECLFYASSSGLVFATPTTQSSSISSTRLQLKFRFAVLLELLDANVALLCLQVSLVSWGVVLIPFTSVLNT